MQIDINNAFLNGDLYEDLIFLNPPTFVQGEGSLVCKLNNALYGLKHAPRTWFAKPNHALLTLEFHAAKFDEPLTHCSWRDNNFHYRSPTLCGYYPY